MGAPGEPGQPRRVRVLAAMLLPAGLFGRTTMGLFIDEAEPGITHRGTEQMVMFACAFRLVARP
jgi:hypothetical protein